MFDRFQPFKKLGKTQSFTFTPNRFEIWREGKMVDSGTTPLPIYFVPIIEEEKEKIRATIFESKLFSQIEEKPVFDEFVSSIDRLQLVTLPAVTETGCMGIYALKTAIGATRGRKEFLGNEPYCCNLFLINDKIAKVTFVFSNPEKMIEFYS